VVAFRLEIRHTGATDVTSWDLHQLTTPALYVATFFIALASGLIPFVINIEIYLLAVAALARAPAPASVGLKVAGQMVAKFLLYQTGKGALKMRFIRWESRDRAAATFQKYRRHSLAVVALSSITGFPPFYGISLLAGAVHVPLVWFLLVGTLGRILRFSLVYLAPGWLGLHT
jgi:membrane protein YqaA with SNARE-associated domain